VAKYRGHKANIPDQQDIWGADRHTLSDSTCETVQQAWHIDTDREAASS